MPYDWIERIDGGAETGLRPLKIADILEGGEILNVVEQADGPAGWLALAIERITNVVGE